MLNIIDSITNNDTFFYLIVVVLLFISAFMFYLIYSQSKDNAIVVKEIKKQKLKPIEEIEPTKKNLIDQKEAEEVLKSLNLNNYNEDEDVLNKEIKLRSDIDDEDVLNKEIKLRKDEEDISLSDITKKLENERESERNIDLTDYEKEQEATAVISYDELLSKTSTMDVIYEDETPDKEIKKVNLEKTRELNLDQIRKEIKKYNDEQVKDEDYHHEEDFLKELEDLKRSIK